MKKVWAIVSMVCIVGGLFLSCEDNDTFNVSYTSNGAIAGEVPTDDNDYKDLDFVTVQAPSGTMVNKSGNPFDRWMVKDGEEVFWYNPGETAQINNANILFIATYDEDKQVETANYTVNHYQQKLTYTDSSDEYPDTPSATDEKQSGVVGADASSLARTTGTYAGFTVKSTAPATLTSDDTTVNIYYERKMITYTFVYNDDASTTDSTSGKYEATLTVVTPTLIKTGYTFTGWKPELPDTFGPTDQTFTAQWELSSGE